MGNATALTRRRFLGAAACVGAIGAAGGLAPALATQTGAAHRLAIRSRTLEVQGRAATVFGILDAAGRPGLDLVRTDGFRVRLVNETAEETIVHWHGLTPPFDQDGSGMSQQPMAPGAAQDYAFDLTQAGTHWMHSHHGLQEQALLAAPLIVRDPADVGADRQDVVVLLHDFSFTPAEEILARLRAGVASHVGSGTAAMESGMVRVPADHGGMHGGMNHGAPAAPAPGMMHDGMAMDLNDVAFDAFLANDRALDDPEVVQVERGGRVRLRIINAASSSNFWIDLGAETGLLVAVDGADIEPILGRRFEIAMAQRLDIELTIPNAAAAIPVLAQREGGRERTGIVLATAGATVPRIAGEAEADALPVLLDLERRLAATAPLAARPAERVLDCALTGGMAGYLWGINGLAFEEHAPLEVAAGERVELVLRNQTMMSHPMHLHGHRFQVVALGGWRIAGAMRDTVLVPAMESVTIAFDADNPGDWPLHCHNLYHMAAGMMTSLRYA